MFATDLYQYKTFLEPKKVACCCILCLEGWEYCSRVLETSPGFYANTDSTTAIPIVLWQYREVNIGIKRSGVSTATPASNPWKDLFNKFITTIRLFNYMSGASTFAVNGLNNSLQLHSPVRWESGGFGDRLGNAWGSCLLRRARGL